MDATENLRRLEATVPMENERAAPYRALLAQQYVSKMDYLQFEQQRIDKGAGMGGAEKQAASRSSWRWQKLSRIIGGAYLGISTEQSKPSFRPWR